MEWHSLLVQFLQLKQCIMQHTHPQGEEAWSRNTKEEKMIFRLYLVTVQELCWKQVSLTPRLPTDGLKQALLPEHQIPVTSQCITSQLAQPKPTNEGEVWGCLWAGYLPKGAGSFETFPHRLQLMLFSFHKVELQWNPRKRVVRFNFYNFMWFWCRKYHMERTPAN